VSGLKRMPTTIPVTQRLLFWAGAANENRISD
jgi:hypothetical protein